MLRGRAILEEIKEAAREWGVYRRRRNRAWPSKGVLGRVVELGPMGAAARSNQPPDPPLDNVSWEVSCFDVAYKNLHERDRVPIQLVFVEFGRPEKKAKAYADYFGLSSCSVGTLYNKKNEALVNMLPDWLELTKDKF